MELLWDYAKTVLGLFSEAAPYLLVGFFLAGLLKVLVPSRYVYRHLGDDRFRSVALASLFGIPLPLCSCSVIPTAASLRKSGASKGATTAFLISTPETGVDSIGLTYALIDPVMTVLRPVAALVTALLTGSLVNRLVRSGLDRSEEPDAELPVAAEELEEEARPRRRSLREILVEANRYAFGPLLDDLTQWFVLGLLISGIVALAVPDGFFETHVPSGWISYLIVLVIGVPIYICAAAATPLAAALLVKGLDPGAALVLLLVGPATNVTTILVVLKLLGRRVVALYIVGVAGCALLFGALGSAIYADRGIDLAAVVSGALEGSVTPVEIAATVVLLLFVFRSARRTRLLARWGDWLRARCAFLGFDPTGRAARVTAAAALVLLYLSSCFSVICPGETGWVIRFGRVVRTLPGPGLVVHLPLPLDRVVRLRTDEVQVVEVGFDRDEGARGTTPQEVFARERALAAEAGVLTGEEDFLRVTFGVQFSVRDAFAYRFRVSDPVEIVRTFAESAVRQAISHRGTNEVLVGHRVDLERETRELLQRGLDRAEAGVEVTRVTLRDVHAPEDVHFAYRDVASALEDKDRDIRIAEGYRTRTLAEAGAEAFRLGEVAESYRTEKVDLANGEAKAFLSRLEAYLEGREITRTRLFYEAAEDALESAKLILLLGADIEVDLWNVTTTVFPMLGDR